MSQTVESRVVEMKFDNSNFERNVRTSLNSLNALRERLDLRNSASECSRSLGYISDTLSALSYRFSTLGIAGMTVIQNLTNAAINMTKKLTSSMSNMIVQGGIARAKNIEQAKFMLKGLHMDVDAVMDAANKAVLNTAYGLDVAAKAAAQLGASGMKAGDDMYRALRGAAGVAAMTNSEYQDIADIFVTISGNGRLMSQQLLQFSSRGLNVAAELAKQLGKTEKQIRDEVSKGKITFEMFYEAMYKAYGEHAAKANEMFSGALSNVKAAFSRVGAEVASPALIELRDILNGFIPVINGLKTSLAPVYDVIKNLMTAAKTGLVDLFSKFYTETKNGDSTVYSLKLNLDFLANSLKLLVNIGKTVGGFFTPIIEAFKMFYELTPDKASNGLNEFISRINAFVSSLKLSDGTFMEIVEIFYDIFGIISKLGNAFKIFWDYVGYGTSVSSELLNSFEGPEGLNSTLKIFSKVLHVVLDILQKVVSKVKNAIDPVDEFAKKAGSAIYSFLHSTEIGDNAIVRFVKNVITNIPEAITIIVNGAKSVIDFFKNIFKRLADFNNKVANAISSLKDQFDTNSIASFFTSLINIVGNLGSTLVNIVVNIAKGLNGALGEASSENLSWAAIIASLSGLVKWVRRMFLSVKRWANPKFLEGSLLGSIKLVLKQAEDSLYALENSIKSESLKKIATAVLMLAGALAIISAIDSDKLGASLGVTTTAFAELIALFLGMQSNKFKENFGKNGFLSAIKAGMMADTVTELCKALLIMSIALKLISTIDPESMGRSLLAIEVLMGTLVGIYVTISKIKMDNKSVSMSGFISLAIALGLLMIPLKVLSGMSTEEMTKSLVGLTIILIELSTVAAYMSVINKKMGKNSKMTGILSLAIALDLICIPLAVLGKMSIDQWGKSLGGLAILLTELVAVAAVMSVINKKIGSVGNMTGVLSLAIALDLICIPLKMMASMEWSDLGKSLGGLAILLAELALMSLAMSKIKGGVGGATALILMATAINILMIPLKILGSMSLESICKALGTLAAAFIIIGVAAKVLSGSIGVIMALSAAVAIIGIAIGAATAGIALFISSIIALATMMTASSGLINAAFAVIIEAIGKLVVTLGQSIAEGLLLFLSTLIDGQDMLIEGITVIILALLQAIDNTVGKFAITFTHIILAILNVIDTLGPKIITVFCNLFISLVENLLRVIEELTPDIIDTGYAVILAFLHGIEDNIGEITETALGIIAEFIRGIGEGSQDITDAAWDCIISFINGLADSIRNNHNDLYDACENLIDAVIEAIADLRSKIFDSGANVVQGFIDGLASMFSNIREKAIELANIVKNKVDETLDIHSPSRELFIRGRYSDEGLANGLTKFSYLVEKAASGLGEGVVDTITDSINTISKMNLNSIDLTPLTPVFDSSNISFDNISAAMKMDASISRTINDSGNSNTKLLNSIDGLRKDIGNLATNTNNYNIGNVEYTDDSEVADAIETLVDAVTVGRRS